MFDSTLLFDAAAAPDVVLNVTQTPQDFPPQIRVFLTAKGGIPPRGGPFQHLARNLSAVFRPAPSHTRRTLIFLMDLELIDGKSASDLFPTRFYWAEVAPLPSLRDFPF